MRRKGFTLVEALVAITLTAIGVAAALQGIAALSKGQSLMMEKERMQRLAVQKLEELVATGDLNNVGGTFEEQNETRYVWEAQINTTGIENLSEVVVTVSKTDAGDESRQETVATLAYEEPITTEVAG